MADEKKKPTSDLSAAGAARKIMQQKTKVAMAGDEPERPKKKKKARPVPSATSLAAARRSKHVGSEGEVSYGQPMTPPPITPKRKKTLAAQKNRFKNASQSREY